MKASGPLLCIGLTTVDVVALPVRAEPHEGVRLISALQMAPAGTAAGAALVAATLGVPTRLAGAVGADAMGRFVRAELAHAGVDVTLLEVLSALPTSATLIPVDDPLRRSVFHAPGASPFMTVTPALRAAVTAARAVHYAGIGAPLLDPEAAALLAAARAGGALTTCDLISPGPQATAQLRAVLPHIDVFLPSAVEARLLTQQPDLTAAARTLHAWGAAAVIIKNGADGALSLDPAGQLTHAPAFAVTPVDTTSCGDSFCAGFIAALDRGWAPLDACRFAGMTAGLVAEGVGTLGALQDFDATVAAMDRYALATESA